MSEADEEYVALAKRLLAIALLALAAFVVVAIIDYRLKRDIVAEADAWREQIRNAPAGQQPLHFRQPAAERQRPARPVQPDPANVRGPVGHVADGAAPAAGDDDRPPIPVISPGNESARPPHRGGING